MSRPPRGRQTLDSPLYEVSPGLYRRFPFARREAVPSEAQALAHRPGRNADDAGDSGRRAGRGEHQGLEGEAIHGRPENSLNWSGIAVEPLREFEADYRTHRPRTRFLPFFVSDVSNEVAKLYVLEKNTLISSAD